MTSTTQRYVENKVLRQSLFGQVIHAVDTLDGSDVAIKKSSQDAMNQGRFLDNPFREVEIMKYLAEFRQHPLAKQQPACADNVIWFKDSHTADGYHWIVTEYAMCGDMNEFVKRYTVKALEPLVKFYFRQMVAGLAFVHAANVVHLDISLHNMLLDDTDTLKIADFGVAKIVPEDGHLLDRCIGRLPGKPFYTAPEIQSSKPYDGKKADVYSLGVCLFIMLHGHYPLPAKYTQKKPRHLLSSVYSLLDHMLERDPTRRYSLDQVTDHPWLSMP